MMKKFCMLVLFAGVSLSVQYISSADDGPAPPVNAAIPCYQLTGGTEGCGSIDGVVSCPADPAAGAAMGSVCGQYERVYSSPQWDKVMEVQGSSEAGYLPDWSLDYLCKVEMDCVVTPHLITGLPVCDVDATTMVVDIKTKIQLNFDDPCNL
jgi:hypothetical protein